MRYLRFRSGDRKPDERRARSTADGGAEVDRKPDERRARSTADGGAEVDRARWGVRHDDVVDELSGPPWQLGVTPTGHTIPFAGLHLLAPAEPTKIIALGYNYRDLFADPNARTSAREPHYTDPGFEPVVFLKGPNTVAAPGDAVAVPPGAEVWVEVEICAVLGRRARGLRTAAEARDAVFGVTIGNDITALNVLGRDWHLARSKSLDGFCPLGPELVRGFDDADRAMTTRIGDRVTQSSTSKNRVLDTFEAVAWVSRLFTLEPGDVVMTGTPAGARQSLVRPGDVVTLAIDGLGELVTPFAEAR
jgi:2-keto-4-pentenoate hydratase/2-oxohepta-3-ene-1,7-dioic acid hydratase in catechol pathway